MCRKLAGQNRTVSTRSGAPEERADLLFDGGPAGAPVGGAQQAPRRPAAVPLLGFTADKREEAAAQIAHLDELADHLVVTERVVVDEVHRAPVASLQLGAAGRSPAG